MGKKTPARISFEREYNESLENIKKLDELRQCQLLLHTLDWFKPDLRADDFELSDFETPADLHDLIWSMDPVAAEGGILDFLARQELISEPVAAKPMPMTSRKFVATDFAAIFGSKNLDLPWVVRYGVHGKEAPIREIIFDADAIYFLIGEE